MAHIIKDERAEVMSDYAIYAIASPFQEKKIYISRTGPARLHKVYVEHFNLRVTKTKDLFARSKEANLLPPMYLLESGRMSKRESFKRCVAWTKYFREHGYSQMTEDILTEYSDDLIESTSVLYKKIQKEPIEEVLQPKGGIFPNYKKRDRKPKIEQDRMIYFRLDDAEHEQVQQAAAELGLSLSAYGKRMTLNGRIVRADLSFIGQYLEEFASSKNLLRQILYSIYTTGNYYPADLMNIQKCIDHLTEIQKKVNEEIVETIMSLQE